MSIFAIGDLHLSFGVDKPMDIYGGQWMNHTERVKENWLAHVKAEDTILIPGDISWGLRLEEAMVDLHWLDQLPGKKILFKGNHDLWWNGIGKLNQLFESITFVQNTCVGAEEWLICGSRGWSCPGEMGFTAKDEKIYTRELGRLRLSLDHMEREQKKAEEEGNSRKNVIGVLHFPPTNERLETSGFTRLFQEYGVHTVVYGHLHGKDAYKNGLQGTRNGVDYRLTSCDKLACNPLLIAQNSVKDTLSL